MYQVMYDQYLKRCIVGYVEDAGSRGNVDCGSRIRISVLMSKIK